MPNLRHCATMLSVALLSGVAAAVASAQSSASTTTHGTSATLHAVMGGQLELLSATASTSLGPQSDPMATIRPQIDPSTGTISIWAPDAERAVLVVDGPQTFAPTFAPTFASQPRDDVAATPRATTCTRALPGGPITCTGAAQLLATPGARVSLTVFYGAGGSL